MVNESKLQQPEAIQSNASPQQSTQSNVFFPKKPPKLKFLIIFFGIFLLLVLLGFSGYAYYSAKSQSARKISKDKISPSITIIPTEKIAITTKAPSPSITPTILIKKTASPTATKSLTPTLTPKPSDTQAPESFFASGSGTYSPNDQGQVCLGFSPPRDNTYSAYDIESRYRFDGGGWSEYKKVLGTVCATLSAGQHSVEVQSKDPAGNEENPAKQITITVENI